MRLYKDLKLENSHRSCFSTVCNADVPIFLLIQDPLAVAAVPTGGRGAVRVRKRRDRRQLPSRPDAARPLVLLESHLDGSAAALPGRRPASAAGHHRRTERYRLSIIDRLLFTAPNHGARGAGFSFSRRTVCVEWVDDSRDPSIQFTGNLRRCKRVTQRKRTSKYIAMCGYDRGSPSVSRRTKHG